VSFCSIIENKTENTENTENNNNMNMGVVLFNRREDAHDAVRALNDTLLSNNDSDSIQLSM